MPKAHTSRQGQGVLREDEACQGDAESEVEAGQAPAVVGDERDVVGNAEALSGPVGVGGEEVLHGSCSGQAVRARYVEHESSGGFLGQDGDDVPVLQGGVCRGGGTGGLGGDGVSEGVLDLLGQLAAQHGDGQVVRRGVSLQPDIAGDEGRCQDEGDQGRLEPDPDGRPAFRLGPPLRRGIARGGNLKISLAGDRLHGLP